MEIGHSEGPSVDVSVAVGSAIVVARITRKSVDALRPRGGQAGLRVGQIGCNQPPQRRLRVTASREWYAGPMRLLAAIAFLTFGLLEAASGQSAIVDASGREIRPPAKVERVYAAGPPASLLVFAIAPDKLTGWTRAMRPDEAEFFPERYAGPARARPVDRAWQHRKRRSGAQREDRPDRRRRLHGPDARLARDRRCRSRRAFHTRCSTAASSPRRQLFGHWVV